MRISIFRISSVWILFFIATTVASRAAIIFAETFESGLSAGWQRGDLNATGVAAYWGVVNSSFGGEGAHAGTNKLYCAGVGFAGTAAAPTYRNSMTAYLQRTIDLSGRSNATLNFWYKLPGIETRYDAARVYIDSTEVWSLDSATNVWTKASLNIDRFVGGPHLLKFEFSSDTSNVGEGWYLDDIAVTDVYTPPPPPPNDGFYSAKIISSSVGSVAGNNTGATSQPGEPAPGNSVWFRWTAPTNGTVTFQTSGSSFDTVLCIYSGTVLTNLTLMGCDDNSGTNNTSVVAFDAVKGAIYEISVRGTGSATGSILLTWNQPNGAGVELLPDLFVWADPAQEYLYGWYLDRTEIPGRALLRLSTATPNVGAGPLELRGSSNEPGVYQRIYLSGGGYHDRYAGTFTFHSGHGHLHFDNWMNFRLRSVLTNNGVGDIVVAGDKTSFAILDLSRYNPNLPGSPPSAQYAGGLVQGLSVGWADVYSANLQDQWIDVTEIPSGRYWLEAIVDPADSIKESDESNNVSRILIDLTVPPPLPTNAPPNDNFTNATLISGVSAGVFGFNFNATREVGEPHHYGATGSASVWYRWTAPSNMTARVSTAGSDFDTILAVYRGNAVNGLTLVTNNDDGPVDSTSSLSFSAVSNTTYRIAVDGYGTAIGNIQFNFNSAWNNDFANSLTLTGNSGSISGGNRGATRQTGEPLHAGISGSNSVWYSWTPTRNGVAVFDTFDSGFDTLLAVYTGASVGALSPVASNDNAGTNSASRVTFTVTNGVMYRIAVDGRAGAKGVVKLSWLGPAPPAIVKQPTSTNAPAGATVRLSVTVNSSAPASYQWFFQGTKLNDNLYISGSTNATLTIPKIRTNNMGAYTVRISNSLGSVTSAPANLIVLENPRVVYIDELTGHVGGVVSVPVEMQAVGDEHSLNFSLLYDPAILSNPRMMTNDSKTIVSVETSQVSSGKLGVSIELPNNQTIGAGTHQWATVLFDAASDIADNTTTMIGFIDQPTAKAVSSTNGASLVALFAAGQVTLRSVGAIQSGALLSNGQYRVVISGVAGRDYRIDVSTDLIHWTPLRTNQMNLSGTLEFTEAVTNSDTRFFRAQLLP